MVDDGAAVPLLTGGDLVQLGGEIPAAFDILVSTANGSIELRCDELLRLTPRRRVVARARIGDSDVIVKLFIGARAAVDREWEERGHAAFVRAGVATPRIVDRGDLRGGGEAPHGGGEALVFECVDAARPATNADLMATMSILAQLHMHGVVQNNLHLGNVLHGERGLVLVDGSGVSGMGDDAPLPLRASVRNLALFLSQFGVRVEPKFVSAWHAYAVARGYTTIDADGGRLLAAVRRARRARVRARLRASLRDNADFVVQRRFGQRLVCERAWFRGAVATLLSDIDTAFAATPSQATATVVRVRADGVSIAIERDPPPRLSSLWRRTRTRRAWRNAHRLRLLGIPTLQPIALVERRFGPGFLLMQDPDGIDLDERFANRHIQPLVALFADLVCAGLVHGDTRATNFIDVGGTIHVVGIADMRAPFTRWGLARGAAHDRQRFIANWSDSATIRAALKRAFVPLLR